MDFLERLQKQETLLFDGGMGTMLTAQGIGDGASHVNLSHAEAVRRIQRQYVEAGAECLITNTLMLNAVYMGKCGKLQLLDDALAAGAECALEASQGRAYVFGDMGPTGEMLAPYGPCEPEAAYEAFARQAASFAAWPLAGIIIETVFNWREAELMLKACQENAPKLPLILSMTFGSVKKGGLTIMGDKAADIALKARELGVCAVGSNCGDLMPLDFVQVMEAMAPAGLPLIAQPNAGKPQIDGEHVFYNLSPAQFVVEMLEVKKAGARLLGGCCGTTPEHIKLLAEKIK